MRLCVYEDDAIIDLEPLTFTRPAFALRCGAATLLERQARYFSARAASSLVRGDREILCALATPSLLVNDADATTAPGTILVNARWLPALSLPGDFTKPVQGVVKGQTAFVVLPNGLPPLDSQPALMEWLDEIRNTMPTVDAGGWMMNHPWDLVEHNAAALEQDYLFWRSSGQHLTGASPECTAAVLGPKEKLLVHRAAEIQPSVVIDTRSGPVLIDRDVVIEPFSRIEGPCWIGPGTHVYAARIYGGSYGPQCRLGGEIESTIIHGYSNKRHDGFLGHSYVGEWCNFGAGTQSSDLRNDYENIRIRKNGRVRDTGHMKVGAFVGDHTRTSIGTLLNSGTMIGPFGHLVAWGSLLPREIPPFTEFAYGQLRARTDLRQMLSTARHVLSRRSCAWTETHSQAFFALYEETSRYRDQCLRETEQRRLRRMV